MLNYMKVILSLSSQLNEHYFTFPIDSGNQTNTNTPPAFLGGVKRFQVSCLLVQTPAQT